MSQDEGDYGVFEFKDPDIPDRSAIIIYERENPQAWVQSTDYVDPSDYE